MNDHLTIVTGHYGSGKTEFAVNLAFRLAREGHAVTLADLDIVNPYFCSRERKQELTQQGIRVIVSKGADSDLPAINPEVYALFEPGVCGHACRKRGWRVVIPCAFRLFLQGG